MTMTLEQVRDGLRTNADGLDRMDVMPMLAMHLRNAADAIDSHLTQPAQSVDVEKVREVIAYLKKGHRFDAEMANKLEAALQEKGNG